MRFFSRVLILIIVFFSGVYVGGEKFLKFSEPIEIPRVSIQAEPLHRVVSVAIDDGRSRIVAYHDIVLQEGDTVFSVLQRLSNEQKFALDYKDYGGDLGVFVEAINGAANNARANSWWQYWVNNRYGEVSASKHELQPGDIIAWKRVTNQL